MSREINQASLELVKVLRALSIAFIFVQRGYSIGYGHTGGDVTQGQCITKTTADQLLRADMESACANGT